MMATTGSDDQTDLRPSMPPPFCYDYPRPSVTADLAVFAMRGETLSVLLVRRKDEPFAGRWALPGGFLDMDETAEVGARRELREETGLDLPGPVELIGVYDEPRRDPRGRTITLAHATALRGPVPEVVGGDDAAEAAWHDAREPGRLAFDHEAILRKALCWLGESAERGPAGLDLLPREFVAAEAQAMLRAVVGDHARARTWLEHQQAAGRVVSLGGRPGRFRVK